MPIWCASWHSWSDNLFIKCYGNPASPDCVGFKLFRGLLQNHRLVRKNMITLLFVVALLVFDYMLYVLIIPEQF